MGKRKRKPTKENPIDWFLKYFAPKRAYERAQYRFAYNILSKSRLHKKRIGLSGTGDNQLTEKNLGELRDICRDLGRNNPVAKGLLKTEAGGVVGSDTVIQAKTEDEGWNSAAETLWRAEMIDSTCDVTGRFNFHNFLNKSFRTYRRDGDLFIVFTDDGLQAIEGECIGTPAGMQQPKYFTVTNGIAVSNQTGRVLGYYVGKSNKWGYVQPDSFGKYNVKDVHHFFNPDRFSQSRGEPALVPSVDYIDKLCEYIDAELVAARVNACFSAYITSKENQAMPDPYVNGISADGEDPDTGSKLEKLEPGMIQYLEPGEEIKPVGQVRPSTSFDPFILRMLGFIGRPLCMPMALVSLDFHGVTNVNARLIFSEARGNWKDEQEFVVRPFVRKVWVYKINQWIERGLLSDRKDKYSSEIFLKRWPYVDPYKEANADKLRLEEGVTTRTAIAAREGKDFKEVIAEREQEEKIIKEKGLDLSLNREQSP